MKLILAIIVIYLKIIGISKLKKYQEKNIGKSEMTVIYIYTWTSYKQWDILIFVFLCQTFSSHFLFRTQSHICNLIAHHATANVNLLPKQIFFNPHYALLFLRFFLLRFPLPMYMLHSCIYAYLSSDTKTLVRYNVFFSYQRLMTTKMQLFFSR